MDDEKPVRPRANKGGARAWLDTRYLQELEKQANEGWLDRTANRLALAVIVVALFVAAITHSMALWSFPG